MKLNLNTWCQCEHVNCHHAYLSVPVDGDYKAIFLGPVCNKCAQTHYAGVLDKD